MKELKFRAWDGENLFLSGECDNYELGMWFEAHSKKGLHGKENVIMQFTGLKDKNGKDIYEGDVVLIKTGVFIWKSKGQCEVEFWDGRFMSGKENLSNWTDVEVIGNIYENPELKED